MQQRKQRIRITAIALVFLCTFFLAMCDILDPGNGDPTPASTSSPTPVPTPASEEPGRWGESRFGEAVFGP